MINLTTLRAYTESSSPMAIKQVDDLRLREQWLDEIFSRYAATDDLRTLARIIEKTPVIKPHLITILSGFGQLDAVNHILGDDIEQLNAMDISERLLAAANATDSRINRETLDELYPTVEFIGETVALAVVGLLLAALVAIVERMQSTLPKIQTDLKFYVNQIYHNGVVLSDHKMEVSLVKMVPKAGVAQVVNGLKALGAEIKRLDFDDLTSLDLSSTLAILVKNGFEVDRETGKVASLEARYKYATMKANGYNNSGVKSTLMSAYELINDAVDLIADISAFTKRAKQQVRTAKGDEKATSTEQKAEIRRKAMICRNVCDFYFASVKRFCRQWVVIVS